MSDENLTPAPSQVIEDRPTNEIPRPGEMPEAEAPKEAPKPLSTREAIAKAFDEAEKAKAPEKPAEPAKDAAKPAVAPEKAPEADKQPVARGDDGKFAKAAPEPAEGQQQPTNEAMEAERREAAGKPYAEPPERFLPKAKEFWNNVPNVVKSDVYRVMQEAEAETTKFREAAEAFEPIKQYHDLAKQSGTTLDKALERYVGYERLLRTEPARAVTELLRSVGLTPAQYAQMVLQNPQLQAAQNQPQPQQAQQPSPEIQSLRAEIEQMKRQAAAASAAPLVQSFAQSHPDFVQIQPAIAEILQSGILERLYGAGLTPEQRLEEAYRMAGGRSAPLPASSPAPDAHSAPSEHRPVDPDGQKSIKGPPTAGQSGQTQRRFKTNREALEAAFAAGPR